MIEIEKKFILTAEEKQRLLKGAILVQKKTIHDIYYDTSEFALAKKDWWLRDRNGSFELKISLRLPSKKEEYAPTQYQELQEEQNIRKALGISSDYPFADALDRAGYVQAFTITTIREQYTKEGFTIAQDSVDYGYDLVEIERMVEHESEILQAEKDIYAFAQAQGLRVKEAGRGKVLEYLRRYNPVQYEAILQERERG